MSGDGLPLGRLRVWDARVPADREAWIAAWERIADGDPFSHPDYLTAFAADGETSLCAHLDGPDDEELLHAFLRRPIREDACGNPVGGGLWDAYTVLLYGGPLAKRSSESLLAAFRRSFRAWARETGLVSEFVRMSPVAARRLPYPGVVREQAPHVVRDLRVGELDELWADVRSNVRRGVTKARAAGLTVSIDETGEKLDDFLRIYEETMDRVGSADRFRFPASAFRRIHESLPGRFAYVYAEHEGRAVAVELVLRGEHTGYFYLGGTETAALPLYASVFVHWEAIAYAWREGLTDYVLTGGVTNTTDDSLLRFKRGFAPHGDALYLTGEQVFDEDAYARLRCCTAGGEQTTFFPAYRAPRGERTCARRDGDAVAPNGSGPHTDPTLTHTPTPAPATPTPTSGDTAPAPTPTPADTTTPTPVSGVRTTAGVAS